MEPIPSVSQAFSLFLQEEEQQAISSFSSVAPAVALVVSSNNVKNNSTHKQCKDRPICTHCNISIHTNYKCYKVPMAILLDISPNSSDSTTVTRALPPPTVQIRE